MYYAYEKTKSLKHRTINLALRARPNKYWIICIVPFISISNYSCFIVTFLLFQRELFPLNTNALVRGTTRLKQKINFILGLWIYKTVKRSWGGKCHFIAHDIRQKWTFPIEEHSLEQLLVMFLILFVNLYTIYIYTIITISLFFIIPLRYCLLCCYFDDVLFHFFAASVAILCFFS